MREENSAVLFTMGIEQGSHQINFPNNGNIDIPWDWTWDLHPKWMPCHWVICIEAVLQIWKPKQRLNGKAYFSSSYVKPSILSVYKVHTLLCIFLYLAQSLWSWMAAVNEYSKRTCNSQRRWEHSMFQTVTRWCSQFLSTTDQKEQKHM